ncbi:MAG: helix-turn-helix domain-containing protein [Paludibacter sp.]|nr:helix-turn-helix domain-containing protein [Paludibacter sp.]
MALPKQIVIKETEKEIKHLLKVSTPFISQRLRVLLILKQNESTGISKREAAILSGVCADSIQKWRTLYMRDGIEGLMKHNKIVYKPSVFTDMERAYILIIQPFFQPFVLFAIERIHLFCQCLKSGHYSFECAGFNIYYFHFKLLLGLLFSDFR